MHILLISDISWQRANQHMRYGLKREYLTSIKNNRYAIPDVAVSCGYSTCFAVRTRQDSEIDQIHLSIEAQCVTTLLPLGDCHTWLKDINLVFTFIHINRYSPDFKCTPQKLCKYIYDRIRHLAIGLIPFTTWTKYSWAKMQTENIQNGSVQPKQLTWPSGSADCYFI